MSFQFGDGSGPLISVQFDVRTVHQVRSVHYLAAASGGCLCRTPGEFANKAEIDLINHEARRLFGECPVHVLAPMPVPASLDYPPVRIVAYFTSSPIREVTFESTLVLAWFQERTFPLVDESNGQRLTELDWDALARDAEL